MKIYRGQVIFAVVMVAVLLAVSAVFVTFSKPKTYDQTFYFHGSGADSYSSCNHGVRGAWTSDGNATLSIVRSGWATYIIYAGSGSGGDIWIDNGSSDTYTLTVQVLAPPNVYTMVTLTGGVCGQ